MTTKVSKNLLDTVYVRADGTDPMTGNLTIETVAPILGLTESDATADNKRWDMSVNAHQLSIRAINDANTLAGTAIGVSRAGTTITDVSIVNPSSPTTPSDIDDLTRKDYVDDNYVALIGDIMTGDLVIDKVDARLVLNDSDGTADNRRWNIIANADAFSIETINDAESASVDAIRIERVGTAIADIIIVHPSSPTTPTDIDDLTRKDYVDDNFVDLRQTTIQEMNGDLSVTSANPAFRAYSSTASSVGWRIISVAGSTARLDVTDNAGSFAAAVLTADISGQITFSKNPLSTATQSTDVNALTKKSYVDDNFVHLDGSKTMTGGLLITAGNPQLRVRNAVLNGLAQIRLQDFVGGDRVQQIFNESNGFFEIQLKDAGGTLQTKIGLTPSGALAVTGTISTVGTVSTTTYGEWTSADTDIDGLIAGATTSGALVEAPLNAHFTIGLRSNDTGDGFQVISKEAGNANYTKNCFEVTADGNTTIGGTLTTTGDITLGDNVHVKFGAGTDLDIYSNGSNSILKYISGSVFFESASSVTVAAFTQTAAKLYFSSSQKLETVTGGINVTGDLSFNDHVTTTGQLQLYQGTSAAGYAIGIESNTMFYRANGIHRWYISTLADAGVSSHMELTTAGLEVANVNATSALNLGSTQQATIEFNATENSIDFIIN